MESFETAKSLVRKGDWLAKLDLKDAYLTVSFAADQQNFLRFCWKGKKFRFTCLPFFRREGLLMVVYLDDMLFLHQDSASLSKEQQYVSSVLSKLGFIINTEKSVVTPTQQLEFLDMKLNFLDLPVSLPTKILNKIISQSSEALKNDRILLRHLASLLGLLAWAIPAIPYAQSPYRHLQNLFIFNYQRANNDLSVSRRLVWN